MAIERRRGLARLLSKAGLCSRAVGAEWIRAGRVSVRGRVVRDPESRIASGSDDVRLDGRPLRPPAREAWAFHKPRGYVTTRSDPDGRDTVYDLLAPAGIEAWVVPVGRLDRDTSGLLLLTNDTQLSERVTNPESHMKKIYRVEARPRLSEAALARLREGVELHDGPTRPAEVRKVVDRGPSTVFEITITEGRNRQVRRMVREVGSKVVKLARTSIGTVHLRDLAAGCARKLTEAEVRALLARPKPAARVSETPTSISSAAIPTVRREAARPRRRP